MTQSTRTPSASSNTWPACPWCTASLAVLDRDPASFLIRYTCLRQPCVCYLMPLLPDAGEVAA